MYGFVGVVLSFLALFAFGRFFALDFTTYPLSSLIVALAVGAAALGLRLLRNHRHNSAHRAEYDKERLS